MARLVGNYVGFPGDTTRRTTTQELPLGARAYSDLGNEYIYVKAGAAIAAKKAVTFQLSTLGYDDVRATSAADQYILGVAETAFSSGDYGWILHRGVATVLCTDAITAGVPVFTGSTSGLLEVHADGTAGGDAVLARTKPPSRVIVLVTAANADTDGAVCYFG